MSGQLQYQKQTVLGTVCFMSQVLVNSVVAPFELAALYSLKLFEVASLVAS
jgi:hypothetical protein